MTTLRAASVVVAVFLSLASSTVGRKLEIFGGGGDGGAGFAGGSSFTSFEEVGGPGGQRLDVDFGGDGFGRVPSVLERLTRPAPDALSATPVYGEEEPGDLDAFRDESQCLTCITSGVSATYTPKGSELDSIGGVPATVGPVPGTSLLAVKPVYPYAASLRRRGDAAHYCGAVLIAPQHVLTAAHCVKDSASGDSSPDVVVGAALHNQRSGDGVEVFKAQEVIPHPNLVRQGYPDLAILKLDREAHTPAVRLPDSADHPLYPDQVVTFLGWGRTGPSSSLADPVQAVQLEVLPTQSCMIKIRKRIRSDQMCSGGKGAGACRGDGGGPIVIPGKARAEDILVGIVGAENSCGKLGTPDIDTRVAPHIEWIKETIGS